MTKSARYFLLVCFCYFPVFCRPPSLKNVENTCYFNAIIQNFYNLEPVTLALIFQKKVTMTRSPFFGQYVPLIEDFRAGKTTGFDEQLQSINDILIGRLNWEAGVHEDATEAFSFMIEDQKDLKKTAIDAVWDAMGFRLKKEISGENPSINFENAWYITIPYEWKEGDKTVVKKVFHKRSEQLDEFFKSEPVEKTKKRTTNDFQKYFLYDKPPEILMIWVKVFGNEKNVIYRIETDLDSSSFLDPLDIKKYYDPDFLKNNPNLDSIYNLIGVVCQWGTLKGGHYTALIKDQYDPERPWYLCNDSSITKISKEGIKKKIKTEGYVFFYRKKSAEEASIMRQKTEHDLQGLAMSLKVLAQK